MPTETYTTAHGDTLTLDLTAEEAAWFTRFRIQAADPTVSSGDLTNEAYADSNPMLAESPIPGRGWVTREVHARPAYRALLDVIYQKTVQETGGSAEDRFTVTVAAAAAELGISEPAVRSAMRSGRLPSMRKGRRLMTSPEAVAGYQVSKRGPKSESRVRRGAASALRVRRGSADGLVFHVSHDGTEAAGEGREVLVSEWSRVFVRSTVKSDNTHQFWELAPGPEVGTASLDPFGVWGQFRIVRSLRGRKALEAWKARPR